ncbi:MULTISPECIES: DNA phosphorothioation-associated DGQHR protein 1 [Bacteroidales]|jgi:DNA phosphorothioation-associated DGQHR protein 1|uniref:DNA phosphorothioation-associated DGQHR protein 1 n=1 Tax=Bacteroidales TaxID=171549 RepID=UPI00266E9726|nr:DNA phosphorothioation-associated DGQHR protein 1 [Alistipes shahii]
MEVKAIKVVQPLGEFYISKIKAGDLLKISTSSVARYDKDGNLRGNQRPLNEKRLKAIANFIMSDEMSFPTSILIAANIDKDGRIIEDIGHRWDVRQTSSPDIYNLIIPDEVSSLVIDGQHRLNAFKYTDANCLDIELVCSIFVDLPNPYQAYLFATINGNQKRVDKSLALELFGFDVDNEPQNTWSPEKLAVYITRRFNFTKESPLYQKIKLAPLFYELEEMVNKDKWLLSTAAMVEGIMSLISSNPQKDRDLLAMKKNSIWSDKTRGVLPNGKPVLRYLYLASKDDELYSVLEKYFLSVKTILWENATNGSVILKTIGISVLFDILKNILEVDGIQESYDSYINKIRDVNYSSHYFALSGGGKTKLRRILKFKLGLLSKDNLQKSDVDFLNDKIS